MKKTPIIIGIILVIVVAYYFYQQKNQPKGINNNLNNQQNMNSGSNNDVNQGSQKNITSQSVNNQNIKIGNLIRPDLADDFVGSFLEKLKDNLNNKDFILKVNRNYGTDISLYVNMMTNAFSVGYNKSPWPNKLQCDSADQSCTARFLIGGGAVTQKYQRDSTGMWYQVDTSTVL